jgi:integration host factor subunit alpha
VTEKNITRADLAESVYQTVGCARAEAANLVEQVLKEICDTLASSEGVKLSGFGNFSVREKAERIGRNPKTGVEVPITSRKAIIFAASPNLKAHVNGTKKF